MRISKKETASLPREAEGLKAYRKPTAGPYGRRPWRAKANKYSAPRHNTENNKRVLGVIPRFAVCGPTRENTSTSGHTMQGAPETVTAIGGGASTACCAV